MKSNEKKLINQYATTVYLYYTRENKVTDVRDYPDYIADEIGLGFSVPFIKKLFKKGLIEEGEKGFLITAEGAKYLEENWNLVKFFNLACPYIGILEYYEAQAKAGEEQNFEEIILGLLKEKCAQYRGKRNYVAVESLNIELAQLYYYLEDYQKALYHYLTTLCYSVSGIKEYVFIRYYKTGKITQKELVAKYNDCIYVVPEIISRTKELAQYYYPEMVSEIYNEAKLGFSLCSRDRFRELVDIMANGKYANSAWQASTTEVFKKKMGFIADASANQIPVDADNIISKEDAENEVPESVAKLEEIAEKESKK